jgi:hypothetical protein
MEPEDDLRLLEEGDDSPFMTTEKLLVVPVLLSIRTVKVNDWPIVSFPEKGS